MARWSSHSAIARAPLLLTVSEFSRQGIVDISGVEPARVAVTHDGVDTACFHAGTEGADVPAHYGLQPQAYLCTLGRLEPRKDHLALVRAYARLPLPRPPLAFIGQRDFSFRKVFDEVEQLGLQGECASWRTSPTTTCRPCCGTHGCSSTRPTPKASACRCWRRWRAACR